MRLGNVVRANEGLRIDAFSGEVDSRGSFAGVVRVLDGEVGRIATGRSVPVRTRRGGDVAFATGESGFEAAPRLLPDGRIQVELRPFGGSVDARGRVAFTESALTVSMPPGETLVVGGIDRSTESSAGGLAGRRAVRARSDEVLLLRVDVERPTSEPASRRPDPAP